MDRKYMWAAALVIALVLFGALGIVSAQEPRKIVKKELLESQYGWLGEKIGFGDRLYEVTLDDGTTKMVLIRESFLDKLRKATIVEKPPTMWGTDGVSTRVEFRAKAPDIPRFLKDGKASHRFEVYDDTVSPPVYKDIIVEPNPFEVQVTTVYGQLIAFTIKARPEGEYHFFILESVYDYSTGKWVYGWIPEGELGSQAYFTLAITKWAQSTPIHPTPSAKTVRIESAPSGAKATSGGVQLGVTPFDMTLIPGDAKILTFYLAGYKTETATVKYDDAPNTLSVILDPMTTPTPTPPPSEGTILVWSNPPGAKVYVDNVEKGTTGADWLKITMPVGTYTVKVVKSGYGEYTKSVTVQAGETAKVEAGLTSLTPVSSPPKITPTPIPTIGVTPGTTPEYITPSGEEEEEPTPSPPGFEAVFAIAGLIAVAYLVLKQKRD